jgi:CubicO group peptidase (beta-lactamase class C family)
VRRSSGRTVGDVLRTFGLDFAVGLCPEEAARAADVVDLSGTWEQDLVAGRGELLRQALTVPPDALRPAVVNSARWRAAEVPAVNGHGSARAVASFYGLLLRGGAGILDPALVAEALAPQAAGPDLVLERDVTWGLGPQLDPGEFGMGGIGGSVGYANVEAGFGFAYVTRTLADHARADLVATALEDVLGL